MIIIITLLILGLIIFLHEFGHFYTAKKFGMPVSEFSIGMGFLIYQKEYKGTKYSLRAIPIGGYVMIDGMTEVTKDDKEYKDLSEEEIENLNKKGFISFETRYKLIVLFAGVIMNFITGFLAYLIFSLIVRGFNLEALKLSFYNFGLAFYNTFLGIKMLFTGVAKAKDLVGPVGLPKVFSTLISQNGFIILLPLFAMLSVNIGILNLLPIPALDGGRIIFVILEKFNIKINKKIEEKIHIVGMILLLLLMIYVLFNDILRYFK